VTHGEFEVLTVAMNVKGGCQDGDPNTFKSPSWDEAVLGAKGCCPVGVPD
jgi:hypothetical protein